MPDDSTGSTNPEATVAVPGVVCVVPRSSGTSVVLLGPSAGWMVPRGIARWEREISFVKRVDMNAKLGRALGATLPHEQIPPKKLPHCYKAIEGSPFLPLQRTLVAKAVKEGVRVYTVGVDRVSAGFFVFMEGGGREPVRVQGNLVEMLAPALKQSGGTDLSPFQDGLIDRLLTTFTYGAVHELDVELADALPRMSRDATGLVGTYLEVFEVQARALASRSARWASSARELARALTLATQRREDAVEVPLFGEARREVVPAIEIQIADKTVALPELRRWTVTGPPNPELVGTRTSVPVPRVAPPSTSSPPPPSTQTRSEAPAPPPAEVSSKAPPPAKEEVAATASRSGETAADEMAEAPGGRTSSAPPRREVVSARPSPPAKPSGVRAVLSLLVLVSLAYAVWAALRG